LEAVKNGYFGPHCCIPKLDSLQILDCFENEESFEEEDSFEDDDIVQYELNAGNMGSLVDNAFAYIREQQIQETEPTQQTNEHLRSIANTSTSCFQRGQSQGPHPNESMDGSNARSLQSFFRPQIGDNGMGVLSRVIDYSEVGWLCQSHSLMNFDNESLELYIQSQGGSMDLRMSTITISLSSLSQVDTFATTLAQRNRQFDLSLDFTLIHRGKSFRPLSNISRNVIQEFLILMERHSTFGNVHQNTTRICSHGTLRSISK